MALFILQVKPQPGVGQAEEMRLHRENRKVASRFLWAASKALPAVLFWREES